MTSEREAVFIEAWLLVWLVRPICQRLCPTLCTLTPGKLSAVSYDPLTHSRHNAGDRSVKVGHEIIIIIITVFLCNFIVLTGQYVEASTVCVDELTPLDDNDVSNTQVYSPIFSVHWCCYFLDTFTQDSSRPFQCTVQLLPPLSSVCRQWRAWIVTKQLNPGLRRFH